MKNLMFRAAAGLVLLANNALAAPMIDNADVVEAVGGLSDAMTQDGWMGFAVAARAGNRTPCCWAGGWNDADKTSCNLASDRQNFGTNGDSPDSESILYLGLRRNGTIIRSIAVGDGCPIDAAGQVVNWYGNVSTTEGTEFLSVRARESGAGEHALYALANTRGIGSTNALIALVDDRTQAADSALFWLGARHDDDGANALVGFLDELPNGDLRRKINFALSQNDTQVAKETLLRVARQETNIEQRADAIFWLAESDPDAARPLIADILDGDEPEEVQSKAIFALAQIGDENALIALDRLTDAGRSDVIRAEALFWLSQKDAEGTLAAVHRLIRQPQLPRQLGEKAMFALSQIDEPQSTQSLLEIIRGDHPRWLRKNALFWLSQSDSAQAESAMNDLLALDD